MTRRIAVCAALAACHNDAPAPPPAPKWIELVHVAGTLVVVSSRVANRTILPEHIADRDLNTAWNSRTGDLVGAWIEVRVPDGATIEELRMTAGHTGHGPRGEDYFTMNPRVRTVTVLSGDRELATFQLDIAKRELQPLRVHGDGTLRIRIDRIEPGTKHAWREACISELEAWGTLAPGKLPLEQTAHVEVAPPPPPADSPCADLAKATAAYESKVAAQRAECNELLDPSEREHCGQDEAGPPECRFEHATIYHRAAPWKDVTQMCRTDDVIYDKRPCSVTLVTETGSFDGPAVEDLRSANVDQYVPGGEPEILLRFAVAGSQEEWASVCRSAPKPGCTAAIEYAKLDTEKLVFP